MPHTRISRLIDALEQAGRLNFRTSELAASLPEATPEALRQALRRQQQRGRLVRVSRGAGHWVIVPLADKVAGAPPLETWLDQYLSKTLQVPYYVALLSAAETYGASPYAVMVTQVMVGAPRRAVTVGRNQLQFHTRLDIERMPTRWHETAAGRFRVSTPELTAVELVQRDAQLGGMARVLEVLRQLADTCSAEGLVQALDAVQEVAAAQRLGALLALDEKAELARAVSGWLRHHPLRPVALESGAADTEVRRVDETFKVRIPAMVEANS